MILENKNSAAKIAANNRYNAGAYDKLTVAVPKGTKELILNQGHTINGYINKLIADDIAKEKPED